MAEFNDALDAYESARVAFLASHERYKAEQEDFQALKAHADRFLRDDRSAKIHQAAAQSKDLVDAFRRTEGFLISDVAMATMALRGRVLGHAVSTMDRQFKQVTDDLDRMIERLAHRGRAEGSGAQAIELAALFERAAIAEIAATGGSLRVAALAIELHVTSARLFLERHVERGPEVILKAIRAIFVEDTKAAALEAAWEALKAALPEIAADP